MYKTFGATIFGAMIGAVLGLVGPFVYALIYSKILIARGADASGTGALFIVTFITLPAGIVFGALIGGIIRVIKSKNDD